MKLKKKLLVYIAGPLTVGDVDQNMRDAMEMATKLMEEGYHVILPHLNLFLERFWDEEGYEMNYGYREWLELDYALLEKCDVLLRIGEESPGADQEVAFAYGAGIPVLYGYTDLKHYRAKYERNHPCAV